jgi:Fe2+ transport system protein B
MFQNIKDRVYWVKEHEHLAVWHRVIGLYVLVFVVWGLYRLLFRFPVWFEEIVLKGVGVWFAGVVGGVALGWVEAGGFGH